MKTAMFQTANHEVTAVYGSLIFQGANLQKYWAPLSGVFDQTIKSILQSAGLHYFPLSGGMPLGGNV